MRGFDRGEPTSSFADNGSWIANPPPCPDRLFELVADMNEHDGLSLMQQFEQEGEAAVLSAWQALSAPEQTALTTGTVDPNQGQLFPSSL